MAGGYGSSYGGGGGKIYLPSPPKKKKDDGFLPLRFAKNLAGDVVDAAVGLPAGLVETVRYPIKTTKAMGTAMWQSWSPLLKGDFEEWGTNFMEHPLAPILDLTAVLTLGAGASARIAYSAGTASGRITATGAAANASRLAKASTTAEGRYINPLVKARRQATGAVLDKALGADKRAARREERKLIRDQVALKHSVAHLVRVAENVSKKGGSPETLRNSLTFLAGEITKTARPDATDALKADKNLVYIVDYSKQGPKVVEAAPGKYFEKDKLGRYVERGDGDVKSLRYDVDGKPAALTPAKSGAWELSPSGMTATLHNISGAKARQKPKGEAGGKSKSRGIIEDDGSISIGGGYSKSLTREPVAPKEGYVWKSLGGGKYKQVKDPSAGMRKIEAPVGQQILSRTDKKGRTIYKTVNDPADPMPSGANWSVADLMKEVHSSELGKKLFTRDANANILRDENGVPLVANRRVIKDYTAEAANSSKLLDYTYRYPLTIWRNLVLGTPRYFFNNAVGMTTLALVNNPTAMRYFVEAVRDIKGENAAMAIINDNTGSSIPWARKHFAADRSVKGHQVGHTAVGDIDQAVYGTGPIKTAERLGNRWFSFVNRVTDEPFRLAATIQRVRSDPFVKKYMDEGLSESDAVDLRVADNPEWRHAVNEEVDRMFGNYYMLNRAERNVRNFVPFYSWNKAITRSTKNLVLDRPTRAAGLVYVGELGSRETMEKLGKMPRFLRGAIPGPFEHMLPGIGKDPGRENVLTTTGMNPYGTISDLVSGAAAVTGLGGRPSESLGQTLGPFAQTGFEVMTGTDLLTGKPLRTNPLGTLQTNFGVSAEQPGLPQLRIIKEALSPGEGTYLGKDGERTEKLYDPSLVREWYQVFGIPIKSLHVKTAQSRAKAEEKGGAL